MATEKKSTGEVPMNNAAVKQKHRMAAGFPVTGQTLPSAPANGPKTPA
jgi:hypothetical protein